MNCYAPPQSLCPPDSVQRWRQERLREIQTEIYELIPSAHFGSSEMPDLLERYRRACESWRVWSANRRPE